MLADARAPAVAAATVVAGLAGVCSSVQTYFNGRLGVALGAALLASCVNNAVALLTILVFAVPTGALARASRRLRDGHRPRAWHLAGGTCGAVFVFSTALLGPKLGIALLTVAIVCGQSVGGLIFDRIGVSPGPVQRFTARRLFGVGLAATAVAVGALGSTGDLRLGFILIGATAGVALATQQIAMGQIALTTGEPLAAALISVGMASLVMFPVALAVTGGQAPHGWAAPPSYWLGGVLGGCVGLLTARVIGTLGALRLVLALVAGQSVGALAIDLASPVAGRPVTPLTVIGVLLTLAAVTVARRRQPVRCTAESA